MDVCKQYNVLSVPEEIVADVLNRLPPRAVGRFNCVSKQWHKYISSELRSIRWKSSPSTVGLFSYQPYNSFRTKQVVRYVSELPTDFDICDFIESISCSMAERVETALVSPNTKKRAITDGSVVRIIASSKGVLLAVLCTSSYSWTSCIYVYNPCTRQLVLIPFPLIFNPNNDAIGFTCFDSSDQLHYMIVCYTCTPYYTETKAIIQTFSSQTGKWLNVYLPQLDVPQYETLRVDNQRGVAVVIHNERGGGGEGRRVFYWFEDYTRTRIFAIDVVEGSYWFIEGPPTLTPDEQEYGGRFLGVSGDDDGHLYMTSIEGNELSLWCLKGGGSNEDWVLKYTDVDFVKLAIEKRCMNNRINDTARYTKLASCFSVIGIHPASPNVVYVQMYYYIFSFDFQSREVRELDVLPHDDFKPFLHQSYQWPRLFPPLPTSPY
ncbi:hypothetical protein LIER_24185 [Lithospermum erythrorhizon]|uniref:F-box domain-containing protein n=1 Tax=Lithospermum erythrorhizon TaxID=34254 RepID=A0AAV3R1E4_LITER